MPQKEVEVKILKINRVQVEKKLLSLGAKKIFDDVLDMHSFKTDIVGLLRVRKEGKDSFLVVKTNVSSGFAKSTDEYGVKVDDFENAVQILKLLDYETKWNYKKYRISYKLNNVRFEFDNFLGEFAYVPEFLEIEASSEQEVKETLKLLNISEDKVVNWTCGDLIRHYKN